MHSTPFAVARPSSRPQRSLHRRMALAALSLLAASAGARAQCAEWDAGFASASGTTLSSPVFALAVFDDGTGPHLYAAGTFPAPGGVGVGGLAKWTGAGWVGFGVPSTGVYVHRALTVYDNGTGPALYAGTTWNHQLAQYAVVGRWNASGWSFIGGPPQNFLSSSVHALAGYDDGSGPALYVGGLFVGNPSIARWNGSSWSPLPGAPVGTGIRALCVFDDGSGPALYVGGDFTSVGGVASPYLARWNGAWSAVGAPVGGTNGPVRALTVHDDGTGPALYAGGWFQTAGGFHAPFVARWNGNLWSTAGSSPLNGPVFALASFDPGHGALLVAGGSFNAAGAKWAPGLAALEGGAWGPLAQAGNGTDTDVHALVAWDDGSDGSPDLYVGGAFTSVGPLQSLHVAEWHGCTPQAYCFGDGGSAPCPCANSGVAGHGCDNSGSTGGARLDRSGSTVPDTLVLTQSGELPDSLSIFLQGSTQIAPVPFGDGLRCVGGTLLRLYVANAVAGVVAAPGPGDPAIRARSAALGDPLEPAAVRHYQVYYRDPSPTFCPSPAGAEFAVGNALLVVW